MTLDFVAHPFWQRLSLVLVHFMWQAAVVAVGAGLLLAAFRPRRPQTRYAIWLTAFLALPCCAALTFWWVGAPRPAIAAPQAASPGGEWNPRMSGGHSPRADSADSLSASWLRKLDAARPWLVLGWLAGVGLFSLRLVCGAMAIAWIRRRAADANAELIEWARRLSTRLGVRLPRVVISRDVRQPLAAGLIRPIIVLPASWATGLSPAMTEAVLAHELAHLRRHDVWLNAIQRVVETALFYHPAVWWLSARVRAERELCCDDLAVTATGDRLAYASALELALRGSLPARGLLLANGIGGRKMAVLERVRHVLNLEPSRSRGWWPGGLAAVAVPALVWCAAAAWQPAQADQPELALVQEDEREVDEDRGDPRPEREGDDAREQRERAEHQRDEAERRREEAERDGERRYADEFREIAQRRRQEAERQRDEAMERARRAEEEFRQRAEEFRNRGQREGDDRRERDGDHPQSFPGGGEFNPLRGGERRVEVRVERRGDLPAAQQELLEVVRELRREVEQLRREVQELRQSRPDRPVPPGSGRFGDGPPRDRDDDLGPGDRGGFGRRPPGPPDRPFPPRSFRPPVEDDRDFRDRGRPEGPERDRPDRERPDRDGPDREQPVRERDDAGERDRGRRGGDRPREDREQDAPERDAVERRDDGGDDRDNESPERSSDEQPDRDRPRDDEAAAEATAVDGPAPRAFEFRVPALFHQLEGAAGDLDDEGSRTFDFFIGIAR